MTLIKKNPFFYELSRRAVEHNRVARKMYGMYLARALRNNWKLHPEAVYLMKKGGHDVLPPLSCSIGLTNRCNLKCTICGSQHHLDFHRIERRSMDIAIFRKVAETLFPLLTTVELNSYGEPLLHPHIEEVLATIRAYGCRFKMQSNGTLLTPKVIDLLAGQCGKIFFSIDAVGDLFNAVRVGADWERVDAAIRRLMKQRDPHALTVCLYPTVTRRTLAQAVPITAWAKDVGIDEVHFHTYDPISPDANPSEEQASGDELSAQKNELRQWIEKHHDGPAVFYENEWLKLNTRGTACLLNRVDGLWVNYPVPKSRLTGHAEYLCAAPIQYVEIGLDGEIYACCRTQRTKLGYATSVKEFADAWFGSRYRDIRKSLRHGSRFPLQLEECGPCIEKFAPGARENAAQSSAGRLKDDRREKGTAR